MKINRVSYLFLLLFLWIDNVQTHGFIAGTLIHTQRRPMAIEQCQVGDHIVSYDGNDTGICCVSYILHHMVDCYIKITIADESVHTSFDQKFYLVDQNEWVKACELKVADKLLCGDGQVVFIEAIDKIEQPQKMYALSIETNHTFCVGHCGIIAHNVEPATGTTLVIIASTVCPPAAAAIIVGEIVAFGMAGLLMYCMHKKLQKNEQKVNGCFSEKSEYQTQGCQVPQEPIETIVCGIPIVEEKINEAIPYVKTEDINVNCEFPIEVVRESKRTIARYKKI